MEVKSVWVKIVNHPRPIYLTAVHLPGWHGLFPNLLHRAATKCSSVSMGQYFLWLTKKRKGKERCPLSETLYLQTCGGLVCLAHKRQPRILSWPEECVVEQAPSLHQRKSMNFACTIFTGVMNTAKTLPSLNLPLVTTFNDCCTNTT